MKNKYITSLLALFFGWLGVHRFYLGERGNGVAFIVLSFVGIGFLLGFIDFVAFLFMDRNKFDRKYNDRQESSDFDRPGYEKYKRRQARYREREREPERRSKRTQRGPRSRSTADVRKISKVQMHMRSGKEHFSAFDYFEAIAQWEKGLEYEPRNAAIHYNLACAYSLTEDASQGFHHLSEAIKSGFDNFDKLSTQDALAFLRIQPEFDSFVKNNYKLKSEETPAKEEKPPQEAAPPPQTSNILSKDILQQLKELGELRDRGILTEEEFITQKKKLI